MNTNNLKYPEIEVKSDGIYEDIYNTKGYLVDSIYVCKLLSIRNLIENIDNDSYSVEIEYEDVAGNVKTNIFPLECISNLRKIVDLSNFGLDINSYNSKGVFKHLQNELAQNIPVKNETTKVGFINSELDIFYAGAFLGVENQKFVQHKHYKYSGKLNLGNRGKLSEYKKFVATEVIGNTALEMALAIGYAGPLIPYLYSTTQISTLLIHTSGQSTMGKSTAARIAASVFGSSHVTQKRTYTTFNSWNTTDNGIESVLANNYGIPIILDEFGKKKIRHGETLDELIYTITEGMGKVRSNVEGKGLPIQRWRTVIFSTGERTLFENTSNAEGLRMRVLDLRHVAYTESAEQSERITTSLDNCCGVAGIEFIKYILLEDRATIVQMYEDIKNGIAKQLQSVPSGKRLAKLPAMILLAVELLKKFDIFQLDSDGITELLVNNIKDNTGEQVGMAERSYDAIMEIVSQNYNRFYKIVNRSMYVDEHDADTVGDVWGYIKFDELESVTEVVFIAKVLEKELLRYGFNNVTTVLHELKQHGYLNGETDKTYRRRTVNAVKTKCYVINVKRNCL